MTRIASMYEQDMSLQHAKLPPARPQPRAVSRATLPHRTQRRTTCTALGRRLSSAPGRTGLGTHSGTLSTHSHGLGPAGPDPFRWQGMQRRHVSTPTGPRVEGARGTRARLLVRLLPESDRFVVAARHYVLARARHGQPCGRGVCARTRVCVNVAWPAPWTTRCHTHTVRCQPPREPPTAAGTVDYHGNHGHGSQRSRTILGAHAAGGGAPQISP